MSTPRIVVGLSGGVDSSVAALLLRDRAQAQADSPERDGHAGIAAT